MNFPSLLGAPLVAAVRVLAWLDARALESPPAARQRRAQESNILPRETGEYSTLWHDDHRE